MNRKERQQLQLEAMQERLGIHFRQPDLLKQALTHKSYVNERIHEDVEDNERLEYLGDAILDFITADMLFARFPTMPEGQMTRLRAALVRTEALAQIAAEYQVGEALIMGKGESASGGRERQSNLCNAFEAVVGAVYLDQGLEAVKELVIPRLTTMQKDVMEEAIRKDPRSLFQEIIQAEYGVTPEYETVEYSGPEHLKVYTVAIIVAGQTVSTGEGKSKRIAAQDSARVALEKLEAGELVLDPEKVEAYRLAQAEAERTQAKMMQDAVPAMVPGVGVVEAPLPFDILESE